MLAVRRLTRPSDADAVASQTPLLPPTSLPVLARLLAPVGRLSTALSRGGDDNTVLAGTLARTAAQVGLPILSLPTALTALTPRSTSGVRLLQVFVHPIDTIKTRLQVRGDCDAGLVEGRDRQQRPSFCLCAPRRRR